MRSEAYGVLYLFMAGDVTANGSITAADTDQIQAWIDAPSYDVRGDLDLEGDVDSTDKSLATANSGKGGGREKLATHSGNRKGYAGYEFDDSIDHMSYYVRYRVLNSTLGQWINRDAIGYSTASSGSYYSVNLSNTSQVGGGGPGGGVGGWVPPPCATTPGLGSSTVRRGVQSCGCLWWGGGRPVGDCRVCGCNGWATYASVRGTCNGATLPACPAPPLVSKFCCEYAACLGLPGGVALVNGPCQNSCRRCCGAHFGFSGIAFNTCVNQFCIVGGAGFSPIEVPIIG